MKKEDFKGGWVPEKADHRDFRYEQRVKAIRAPETLPASADIRSQIVRVKDQGNLGSCVAHGTTSCFEALQVKQTGSDFPGCRLAEYQWARILGGYYPGDNGAEIRDGVKATVKYGVAHETLWPYNISQFDNPVPANVVSDAVKSESTNYYLVDSANGYAATLTNIKNAIAVNALTVVFGTPVYNGIFDVGSDGMIPLPSGASVGGHAMLFVGYDDTKNALLTLNSWGTGWGMNGFGWLPYQYVTTGQVSDCWSIANESEINPPPPPEPSKCFPETKA
jgi:C1A family cysteine protease